jgi:hypothetical protein
MLDRIATAELQLQLEPTPFPGALRTRRWREKKAEENRPDSVAGADLIISNSSNQQQTTTDYCGHKAISAFDRSLLRTSCNGIIFL